MTPLALALLALLPGPVQDAARDEAAARRVAESVEIFVTYTGRWPRSLEDLVRRPEDVRFWPEGGFWVGPLPKAVAWKDGRVLGGSREIPVSAPTASAIVPPTDRLRDYYAALVRLRIARAAVREYYEVRGKLPAKLEDVGGVPADPSGKPFAFEPLKTRARLAVRNPAAIAPSGLTPEELRGLEEGARWRPTDEEARVIRALAGKLSDDDLETREDARRQLRIFGAPAGGVLRERLASEKDPDVCRRLAEASRDFPEREPAWKTELRPLSVVVLGERKVGAEAGCEKNLRRLWMLQNVYMSQFGGRTKKMSDATGKDFWLALTKTEPPLIDETALDILVCPGSEEKAAKGVCSYAGPAEKVSRAATGDAVGLCDDEGHGDDVFILLKSGDVIRAPRGGPEHEDAKKKTKR